MSSQLVEAMETMHSVYQKYLTQDDKDTLRLSNLKELVKNELGEYIETKKGVGTMDKVMKDLDEFEDGGLDFNQFLSIAADFIIL